MKKDDEKTLRRLLDLPDPSTTEYHFKQKVKDLITSLGNFTNVELGHCEVYDDGDVNIFIVINDRQDIVEPGLPKQTLISTDMSEIEVNCLAETYTGEDEMVLDDIEKVPFSWKTLKDLIVKYQPQTY